MKAVVVPVAAAAVPVPKEKKRHSAKRTEPVPVPEEVRRGFVQLKNSYFFPDGARAFTDRGDRLTTPSENTEVIRSLVAIAQARGWGEVVVGGSERFRRDAWAAAHAAGLEVRGYKPTQFEQTRLVRSLASRSIPEGSGGPPSDAHRATERSSRSAPERAEGGPTAGALLAGMLVEHGRGPYQHDLKEPISYYVKIETPKGDRTIWGVDLERAFKESLTQPQAGDAVGLRSIRREPVKVKSAQRDGEGNVVSQKDLETHRNHWVVEKQAFFEQRAQAAQTLRDTSIDPKQGGRQHPELVGTYLQVRAAELAAKKLRDPQDQARFVERVREALANSVASGEPLPPVRLREERTVEPRARAARTPEPALARA
jgi:putative DNA primase/helicase